MIPRTKEMASMLKKCQLRYLVNMSTETYELDFPEPFGPIIDVK